MSRLNDLLQTEMTRKQFLKTVGFALASLCGLQTILNILDYQAKPSHPLAGAYGYGDYDVKPGGRADSFGKG